MFDHDPEKEIQLDASETATRRLSILDIGRHKISATPEYRLMMQQRAESQRLRNADHVRGTAAKQMVKQEITPDVEHETDDTAPVSEADERMANHKAALEAMEQAYRDAA